MSKAAEALTLVWKTLGIEDHPVEEVRTVTMRSEFRPLNTSTEELVQRLPRLLREGDTDTETMPELRIKGTLGEGGMGLVELAEQLSVGRDVAVKKGPRRLPFFERHPRAPSRGLDHRSSGAPQYRARLHPGPK